MPRYIEIEGEWKEFFGLINGIPNKWPTSKRITTCVYPTLNSIGIDIKEKRTLYARMCQYNKFQVC